MVSIMVSCNDRQPVVMKVTVSCVKFCYSGVCCENTELYNARNKRKKIIEILLINIFCFVDETVDTLRVNRMKCTSVI